MKQTPHITPRGTGKGQQERPGVSSSTSPLPLVKINLDLRTRGMSGGYALFMGLIGLAAGGLALTIMDQILMGDMWNFSLQQQLSGTQMQIFATGFAFLPIIVTLWFLIGNVNNAHKMRNEI